MRHRTFGFSSRRLLFPFLFLALAAVSCSVQLPELKFTAHGTMFEKELLGDYRFLQDEYSLLAPEQAGGRREASPAGIRSRLLDLLARRDSRKSRYLQLLKEGLLGENRAGYLVLYRKEGLPAPRVQGLQRFVAAENRDRNHLLKILLQEARGDPAAAARIRRSWTQFLQTEAPPGSWIQAEDGRWYKK